jgi:GDP-D-mannose 3', 5'-epimerase
MARVCVSGSGGFLAGHLVKALLDRGEDVRATDIKPLDEWYQVHRAADNWPSRDLSGRFACMTVTQDCDVVYHLAADMGGMGYIEANKAACALNVLIDAHMLLAARDAGVSRYFYASTACCYRADRQDTPNPAPLREREDVYPAQPEAGYGWAKLYGEHLCRHFREDFGLETRIARLHSVFGPMGTWDGGREKVPAALCRKVAQAKRDGAGEIEIWGDGEQARSFLYVDDAVEAILLLAGSDCREPLNIGSDELVTVNELAAMVEGIAGVELRHRHVPGPLGVRGRSSDNTLIGEMLGWKPKVPLRDGLAATYQWVSEQVAAS